MAPLPGPARIISIILLGALAAGACSATGTGSSAAPLAGGSAGPSTERPLESLPDQIPASPSAAPVTGEVPDAVIETARSMLVATVGADAANATVVVAQAVTWPDGSLGCPEPGVKYEQVEVPGYQIVFDVGGIRHDFRSTAAGNVRACEPGGSHAP